MPAAAEHDIRSLAPLLDALNCGAMLIDRAGRVVYANARLCEMLDQPCNLVVGGDARQLYDGRGRGDADDRGAFESFGEAHEGEFHLPRPDGSRLPVILSGRSAGAEPPLADYRLITAIDISAQKKAEARIQDEYREITRLSDTVLEQALTLKRYSERLEERVRERTAELHEANMEAIYMLAVASEAKDADTGAHVRRIERYAIALAQRLGLPAAEAQRLGYSAILHDVGKMVVPDRILKKPGPLDGEERKAMQAHTEAGERILSKKPFFDIARQIARSHHENWNGSGYPDGCSGSAIPLPARIVRLADVFDALTSERVYKPAWPVEQAVATICDADGVLFDPEVVRAFRSLVEAGEFESLRK